MSDDNTQEINGDNGPSEIELPPGGSAHVRAGENTIKVLVIRNDGSGDSGHKTVPAGARVSDVIPNVEGQQVRVNGRIADGNTRLSDHDKVSATPQRVAGA